MRNGMSRCRAIVLLGLAPLVAARGAGGDDAPEQVLARAGLVKDGPTLILRDTAGRNARIAELRRSLEPVAARLGQIDEEEKRLRKEVDAAERAENRDDRRAGKADLQRAKRQLEQFRDDVSQERKALKQGRERAQMAIDALVAEAEGRYRDLWADPKLRAALRELNLKARPKLVLGPVADPAEYLAKRRGMALGRLAEKGLVFSRREGPPRLLIQSEAEPGKLAPGVRKRRDALLQAPGGPLAEKKGVELARRREAVAKQLAAAKSPDRRRALAAQVEAIDVQIRRLGPGGRGAAGDDRESRREAARADLADAVRLLRRAADVAAEERRALEADAEFAALLEELRSELDLPLKLTRPAELRPALTLLEECERLADAEAGAGEALTDRPSK